MKVVFTAILLMILATYGCTADDSPALEQNTSDVVEIGDITVEDAEELLTSDVEVSLDDTSTVPTVEEDVEN